MVIDENMKAQIRSLAQKHDLELALLFGSQVSGKTHRHSDVDIGFIGDKAYGPMETVRLERDFTDALKMKGIELTDLRQATPLLLQQVARQSKLLYEAELSVYNEFVIYAYKRYFDAKPLFALRDLSLQKFLQRV